MDKRFYQEAKVSDQFKKYHSDIENILNFSDNVPKDLVKYILNVLKDDQNPEIGKVLVEVVFEKHTTMLTILKVIVKVLYVVSHITKYKYGEYHRLKKYIDDTLQQIGTTKAEIAKKKYEMLLCRINQDKTVAEKKDKKEYSDDIRDTINKKYIKFVKK